MIKNLLAYVLLFSLTAALGQNTDKVLVTTESSLYVSGDLIRMQVVAVDATGHPLSEETLIHSFLVAHDGTIVMKRKYLITDIDKAGYFQLPDDLETGNYKLVLCLAGAASRTEVLLPIYNPNIFSSSIPPQNADLGESIGQAEPEERFNVFSTEKLVASETATININLPEETSGIMVGKLYDPRYETSPKTGEVVNQPVPENIEDNITFQYLSSNPDSRISLYFLEQGYVEEFYLAEEAEILEKLPTLFGSGNIYVYQFDPQGNRLGEVPAIVERADQLSFGTFSNTVPFDTYVRQVLEKKRVRKYIDQVYRNGSDPVTSLMAEEFDTRPDRSVLLENYSGIATLREALSNVTPKTQVIRRGKSYEIRLSPENSGFRYTEQPFILVDGIPGFAIDSLYEMPVSMFKSVDLFISLEKLRRFGTFGRYGVLSIHLAKEEDNPWLSKLANLPVYNGVSDLVAEPINIKGPDLRPVALWDPSIRISADGNGLVRYKTTDVAGEYVFWSYLIYPDGRSIHSTSTLQIAPH